VRRKGNESKVKHLLLQHKVVGKKVDKYVEGGIASTASRVAVHLQGHKSPEQRVE
jgi:hypothetical protein